MDRTALHDLKNRIDVLSLLEKYEDCFSMLTKTDRKWRGTCPFPEHDDSSPSFVIDFEGRWKGTYRCSCSSGDIFEFIKRIERCNFGRAIQLVQQLAAGVALVHGFDVDAENRRLADLISSKKIERPKPPQMPQCVRSFSPIAHYMQWRRNYSEREADKIIKLFDMAWCLDDRSFPNRNGDMVVRYYQTIIIPVCNIRGEYRNFMAQNISHPIPDRNKIYGPGEGTMYDALPGGRLAVLSGKKWCLVTEGIWDVAKCWLYDLPAVSTLKASISSEQAAALISHFDTLYLAYDKDDAGEKACEAVYNATKGMMKLFRVAMEQGQDPDNLNGDQLVEAIENAALYAPRKK